ncbi:hypothetical protein TNCT_730761 [Trichonephila clavata]|uniref:Uncharacterized protein n=1 Tax=Trichonephila clavata TaxID=2740835 RepID=A0A8X6J458_TRICU|nr:hypothetical protein TNCT_730761 [Trichonephila clavata]
MVSGRVSVRSCVAQRKIKNHRIAISRRTPVLIQNTSKRQSTTRELRFTTGFLNALDALIKSNLYRIFSFVYLNDGKGDRPSTRMRRYAYKFLCRFHGTSY